MSKSNLALATKIEESKDLKLVEITEKVER